jgi:hypothetical protein
MEKRRVPTRGTCRSRSLPPLSAAAFVAILLVLGSHPWGADAAAHRAPAGRAHHRHAVVDEKILGDPGTGVTSSDQSAASGLVRQAEEIEAELTLTPADEGLLAHLTRTRINAADAMIQTGAGESKSGTEEVKQQFALAAAAWSKYLKAAKKPSVGVAAQVAPALFQLAELSSNGPEALKWVERATAAEKIVTERRPGKDSWSTLAFYELFAQRYKAADESIEKAIGYMHTKFERKSIEKQFEEVEKKAKQFGRRLKPR